VKFYICTALANADQHRELTRMLQAAGPHYLTYDWTIHGSVLGQGEEKLTEVARDEVAGVLAADTVIVLLPPKEMKTSARGTHAELGIALGANAALDEQNGRGAADRKRVVVWDWDGSRVVDGPETCAFYFAPSVERVTGPLTDLVAYLT